MLMDYCQSDEFEIVSSMFFKFVFLWLLFRLVVFSYIYWPFGFPFSYPLPIFLMFLMWCLFFSSWIMAFFFFFFKRGRGGWAQGQCPEWLNDPLRLLCILDINSLTFYIGCKCLLCVHGLYFHFMISVIQKFFILMLISLSSSWFMFFMS